MEKLLENESIIIAVALMVIAVWSMCVPEASQGLASNVASGLIGYISKT